MTEDTKITENNWRIPLSIVIGAIIISGGIVYRGDTKSTIGYLNPIAIENKVLPKNGVELPITWGDLGTTLLDYGVIDEEKLKTVYGRELTAEMKRFLYFDNPGKLRITEDNAGFVLNLFWALGLSSKNEILEVGEMVDKRYGGAANFASTGGWTLAEGSAMNHYGKHEYFNLSPEKQALVEKMSSGIYRPCCGNSAHFPDCNHGMAMLGLLELMASQGASEDEMWRAALAVNSFWFPENYTNIARYKSEQGVDWDKVDPREVLGAKYSSASGYAKIASVINRPGKATDGCDVGGGAAQRSASGCGI